MVGRHTVWSGSILQNKKQFQWPVPVELAIETCRQRLSEDPSLEKRTPFDVTELCQLLRFCLGNTYFSYNGEFYQQTFGTAMGASISVTTANLAMEAIESKALDNFQPRSKLFLRYVDDCFCVLDRRHVQRFLEHLNGVEPSIQFTVEEEASGSLPFLDAIVSRSGEGLTFGVYRKPTHSGRYLDFKSAHPTSHKRSVVMALTNRARRTCSDEVLLQKELATIEKDLKKNGYPLSFVKNTQRRMVPERPLLEENVTSQNTEKPKRAVVPYVPGISEALARVFRKHNLQLAHAPTSKLRNELVNVKGSLPRCKFPGVVYRIACAECPAVYIGESGNFCKRIKQHQYDVRKKKRGLQCHCGTRGEYSTCDKLGTFQDTDNGTQHICTPESGVLDYSDNSAHNQQDGRLHES